MALLMLTSVYLVGCVGKQPIDTLVIATVPRPLFPTDNVINRLEKCSPDPNDPVWYYMSADYDRKCKQERALGYDCPGEAPSEDAQ